MTQAECKEVFALLSQYLDQELAPDMCKAIDTHMAGCLPCEDFLASLRKTIDLCRAMQARHAPGPLPAAARSDLLEAFRRFKAGTQPA